jgi:hypothetical protein
MTGQWFDARVREIRERMTARDEASLWTLFFEDPYGVPLVAQVIDGAMSQPDRGWLPNFARVLEGVGASACLLAVIRHDGRPRPEDRKLWSDLQVLPIGGESLMLGFVIVGTTSYWRAPGSDAPAA